MVKYTIKMMYKSVKVGGVAKASHNNMNAPVDERFGGEKYSC